MRVREQTGADMPPNNKDDHNDDQEGREGGLFSMGHFFKMPVKSIDLYDTLYYLPCVQKYVTFLPI